ncbi:MAG: AMMECR1 domain-containing protein [Oscillospiraceae bacterium]|nr:AMMECR1 domain-containing protein [Oscillospiraceae bacterium]
MEFVNRIVLVKAVKYAMKSYLTYGKRLAVENEVDFPAELMQPNMGVFITLWRYPHLDIRASKGTMKSGNSLLQVAIDAGIGAVKHDAIFPAIKTPVQIDEHLLQITLIKNVQTICAERDITLNKDAVIVSYKKHTSIFLPELVSMTNLDYYEALSQLCLKSGLPGNMWNDPELNVYKGQVETFFEEEVGSWNIVEDMKHIKRNKMITSCCL